MSEPTNAERAAILVASIQIDNPKIVAVLEALIAALDEAEARGVERAAKTADNLIHRLISDRDDLYSRVNTCLRLRTDLEEALAIAREFIEDQVDVRDGSYGEPEPNNAMTTIQRMDAVLGKDQTL